MTDPSSMLSLKTDFWSRLSLSIIKNEFTRVANTKKNPITRLASSVPQETVKRMVKTMKATNKNKIRIIFGIESFRNDQYFDLVLISRLKGRNDVLNRA
jgi:hypothetical protein